MSVSIDLVSSRPTAPADRLSGPPIRVVIACSGLGHIQRGIECWAKNTAAALRRHAARVQVTLFGTTAAPNRTGIACLRRTGRGARGLTRLTAPLGGWRAGLGSACEVEQTSFALNLLPRIARGCDIPHVQDVKVAEWFERARRLGLSRARVLLANGTGEAPKVLARFPYLQHLTPEAAAAWEAHRPPAQRSYAVPNFIDVDRFTGTAGRDEARAAARAALGLPQDAVVVLCCAAIRSWHKRVDYLIRECAAARRAAGHVVLVLAGAREADTDALVALAREEMGDAARIFIDHPPGDMPALYQAADIFALAALHELFGIVLLEAMSCALPVICHDPPDFRYIVGASGLHRDLAAEGGLRDAVLALCDPALRDRMATEARHQAVRGFSADAVTPLLVRRYQDVMQGAPA